MRKVLMLILVVLTLLALTPTVLAQDQVHIVQPGENLYRIALRYGTTIQALAAANGLSNTGRIYVGQQIVVPSGGNENAPTTAATDEAHVVRSGENLYRIALQYGLSAQALASANGITNLNHIIAGQRLTIPGQGSSPVTPSQPAASGDTYIVQHGDTLSRIALRHGVSMWTLAQLNGIQNTSFIYVGQTLSIPSGAIPSPEPPAPVAAPTSERWIDVNLSTQSLTAYEGNTPVRSTLVSTGLPATPTVTGQYRIYVKYTSAPMSGPGYYLPGVPYVMYFYRGYGLHGTYWHANFGYPMSHGCINLPTPEAQWLHSWASVGTLVNIHY